MKFRFNREEMSDALKAVCAVAAARTPKPILRCVRLEVQSDVLLLSGTDTELSVRCAVTQVEVDEPGDTLVVADTLSKIVNECDDEILNIETDSSQLHIRGAGSHFQVVTQDADEFPLVPTMEDGPDFAVERDALFRLVEWTVFASARESTRYAMNGVLWEVEGDQLTLVATDGRRLSLAKAKLAQASKAKVPSAIVPGKAMSLLSRLPGSAAGNVGVKITSNQLLMSIGGAMISSSLVEGHFPKYQDVIPQDCDRIVEVKTADLLGALRRASLLTNEESKGVRFAITDDSLTLSSRAPEQGEATVSIPVKYKGEPVEIGFNPVFLLDVLRVTHADDLSMAFKEANRPGLIRLGQDFLYVVMPVSLASA